MHSSYIGIRNGNEAKFSAEKSAINKIAKKAIARRDAKKAELKKSVLIYGGVFVAVFSLAFYLI